MKCVDVVLAAEFQVQRMEQDLIQRLLTLTHNPQHRLDVWFESAQVGGSGSAQTPPLGLLVLQFLEHPPGFSIVYPSCGQFRVEMGGLLSHAVFSDPVFYGHAFLPQFPQAHRQAGLLDFQQNCRAATKRRWTRKPH